MTLARLSFFSNSSVSSSSIFDWRLLYFFSRSLLLRIAAMKHNKYTRILPKSKTS